MNNPWKILSSKIVYQNPWIKVREDSVVRPDGSPGIYGVIETNDSVIVGALNDKNELYLVHTFSYPAQRWHWELPGGGGDKEDFVSASKRELFEETGINAAQWAELPATRPFDGLSPEKMATLLATDLSFDGHLEGEDRVIISEGRFFNFDAIESMIFSGEIDEGQTITAIYLIEKYLDKQK
jgi:8-oxo-dGTP pyrophosphatase MutT (NUDIX family)